MKIKSMTVISKRSFLSISGILLLLSACGKDSSNSASSKSKFSIQFDSSQSALALDDKVEEGETEGNGGSEASEEELSSCGEAFGKDSKFINVTEKGQIIEVESGSVMAIKLSGNKSTVNVTIKSEDTAAGDDANTDPVAPQEPSKDTVKPSLDGICLIMSGNKTQANVSIQNFHLKKFALNAKGNKSETVIQVKKEGIVDEFTVDIQGNKGALAVSGEGQYSCPDAVLEGNKSSFVCQKKSVNPPLTNLFGSGNGF